MDLSVLVDDMDDDDLLIAPTDKSFGPTPRTNRYSLTATTLHFNNFFLFSIFVSNYYRAVIGAINEQLPSNMFAIMFPGGERKIVQLKPNLTVNVFLQAACAQRNIMVFFFTLLSFINQPINLLIEIRLIIVYLKIRMGMLFQGIL